MKTIKFAPNTRTTAKKYSKAAKIRRSILNGAKDLAALARRFKTPYSWVYRIVMADKALARRVAN